MESPSHTCKFCSGTRFGIAPDGDGYLEFCMSDQCLTADKEASAKKAEKSRFIRDDKGNITTGADTFSMGSRYKNASLSRIITSEQVNNTINHWLKADPYIVTLYGNPGSGKTYLCAALLNFLYDQKKEVYYTNHRRFMSMIQKGMASDIAQHDSIKKISEKEIVLFDDLGSGTNTEWQSEMFLEFLDTRYSWNLKTLITTNLTPDEIDEHFGSRTLSRLRSNDNKMLDMSTETDLRR